jgi:hypothetical protein
MFGNTVTVGYGKNRGTWGTYKYGRKPNILIDPMLSPTEQMQIFLHEAMHAIFNASVSGCESKISGERICDVASVGLLALLRDNPNVVEWLLGKESND